MSQFIEGTHLQGPLPFHMTPYQLIKPSFKRFPKNTTIDSLFAENHNKKVVDNICLRYSQIEQQNFKADQEQYISKKCSNLKHKFNSCFNPAADSRRSIDFLKEQTNLNQQATSLPMNLKQMANAMPRQILLQKKYNRQITIKMMAIQQAKRISKQKQDYNNWLTSINNIHSSPNFNKMTYLIQKLAENAQNSRTIYKYKNHLSTSKHQTVINTIDELNNRPIMAKSIVFKQQNLQYRKRKNKYLNRICLTKSPQK